MKKFFCNSLIFSAVFFSALFFTLAAVYYLSHKLFGNYTVNQALFHIMYAKDMIAGAPEKMLNTIKCGLAVIILLGGGNLLPAASDFSKASTAKYNG